MISAGAPDNGGDAETTGRFVVTFADGVDAGQHVSALQEAGLTGVARSTDLAASATDADGARDGQAVVFSQLGVAVVSAEPGQIETLESTNEPRVLSVEPERIHHALTDTLTEAYTAGYTHGAADLAARLSGAGASAVPTLPSTAGTFQDTSQYTWGLQAVCVTRSTHTGSGITIAVLDTGFDLDHPDFAGRAPTTKSFVAGQAVQDGKGHGTHCIGTACGPKSPVGTRRYGVASGARILVGKVLNNDGRGRDADILAGIDWAITQGADIVSMSLGADVKEVSQAYEKVGQRALSAGTLIIAAAGNNADRPGDPGFVGIPANSPSIMAVASLDPDLGVSFYSAASTTVAGGQIDIAAPGRDVYSSWPMPTRYNTISGTSMATPHVAGVAALWCEATGHQGRALWSDLTQHASRLAEPSTDVGAGLVQAPA